MIAKKKYHTKLDANATRADVVTILDRTGKVLSEYPLTGQFSTRVLRDPTPNLILNFFVSSRRRHTRWPRDWSSDVCSSDLRGGPPARRGAGVRAARAVGSRA